MPPLPFLFHNNSRSREQDHSESTTEIAGQSMSTAAILNKSVNQSSSNVKCLDASVTELSSSCITQPSTSHAHINESFVSDTLEPSASSMIESSVSYTPKQSTHDVIKPPASDLAASHASCSTEMSVLCEDDLFAPSVKHQNPQL